MLSVIIPAYKEETTIGTTLLNLTSYLGKAGLNYEIVVVDDGSPDNTFLTARKYVSSKVRVFNYPKNKGKGHALKYGFGKTRGDTVVFFDAGMDFPSKTITNFVDFLERTGSDVVIGSKRHPQSNVRYPISRRILSFGTQKFIKLLFNLDVTDTQVGMKVFKRCVLEDIMPRILVRGYAFDVELLALAHSLGYKIVEAPVELDLKFSSAASPKFVWSAFWDACSVFYRLRITGFYHRSEYERKFLIKHYPAIFWDKLVARVSQWATQLFK